MIKVSIIVPIYNTSKYLCKCIDSLVNQTEKNIEIILINDGSTDNSEEIINTFNDSRIRYYKNKNHGIGYTRNFGIKKASGKYIMFIDSDDYISADCVEVMYNKIVNDNCDIVVSDFFKDFDGRIEEFRLESFNTSSLKKDATILEKINLGPCNKLFKNELVKDIKFSDCLKYEDVLFVVEAFIRAKKISKINECLSYYVIHENSQTTKYDDKIMDIIEVNKKLYELIADKEYLHKSFTNISVMMLTDYIIQARNITDNNLRNKFIDDVFSFLYTVDTEWKKCSYLTKTTILKKFVKTNKFLVKLYDYLYSKLFL